VVVHRGTAATHKLLDILSVVKNRTVLHDMLLMNFKAAAIKKAAERERPMALSGLVNRMTLRVQLAIS
jgi:hypothetical protein